LSADIYAESPYTHRGGGTGLQVRAGRLHFDPCIPRVWCCYSLSYRHVEISYEITAKNPTGVTNGVAGIALDGERQPEGQGIPLLEDGQAHRVRVELG
jgi:cyclic beta-1,2-glucan synthetase